MSDTDQLVSGVLEGNRRALARLITRIESTRKDHRAEASDAIATLLPESGKSIRIGISGVPGVGKSSFIETFGLHVVEQGHKVAVLAVDPSSPKHGGSILGDKTRMEKLARHPAAYVRPSPSSGSLGGVARRTRETILAVEAAGFDVVLVETVGVGQSEYAVADLVDMFVLLVAPGGGDDLQGIKKGIVEMADLLVVTKNDGDLQKAASRAFQDYSSALRMLRGGNDVWQPEVLRCSAHTGEGIPEVWARMEAYRDAVRSAGLVDERRAEQAASWMWDEVTSTLLSEVRKKGGLGEKLEADVRSGKRTPADAAGEILKQFDLGDF
ncbi:methylmalonyl Co-A mutase-associated GTPase MeaB [Thalassospiraceae bacterium LMO-JJ14]|nr:methylmalonyl Co-A mutase-associated GTPase MeaB [Thalassospiraceae bacterium LMO-JJ14]